MNIAMAFSKQSKRFWLGFYLVSILTPHFCGILVNFNLSEFITKPLGIIDELFVVSFFLFSLFIYKSIKLELFECILVIFLLIGFLSSLKNEVPLFISFLGAFNITKGMLIFICFKNLRFSTKDIIFLLHIICSLLPFLVLSDLFDIIWPDFRISLGYDAKQIPEERMGVTSVYGFFTPTAISFLCNTIYVANKVYFRSNLSKYISAIMLLLTLKVKDTIGFLMVVFFSVTNKIRKIHIIGAVVFFVVMFLLYSIALPEHFGHYFQSDEDDSNARVATVFTCAKIVYDQFPLGVGFGRFASSTARDFKSPVYSQYGIDKVNGLDYDGNNNYISDCFWPMIFGETGALGAIVYIFLLGLCFCPYLKEYFKNTHDHKYAFVSLVFIFALVCSLAKATLSGPPDSHLIWGFAGLYYQKAFGEELLKRRICLRLLYKIVKNDNYNYLKKYKK